MAFVVVLFRGEELTRRELTGPLVIGRAPECDVSVRDILLSRRHCRIEPASDGKGWVVEDLGSKNGTLIGGQPVTRTALRDAMGIRMGKTGVKFYAGAFRPGSSGLHRATAKTDRKRPADPFEALSGTVEAFDYKSGRPARDVSRLPAPRPKPTDPAAYSDEDVYSLVTELASSSWDSIYATASGPAAVMVEGQANGRRAKKVVPGATTAAAAPRTDLPPRSRHVPADASLQVVPTEPVDAAPTHLMAAAADADASAGPTPLAPNDGPSDSVPRPAPVVRPDVPTPVRWRNPMAIFARGIRNVLTGRFLRRAS